MVGGGGGGEVVVGGRRRRRESGGRRSEGNWVRQDEEGERVLLKQGKYGEKIEAK